MTELSYKQPLRLREKLLTLGTSHLSDTELLAVFISRGNRAKTSLQLAYELMNYFGDLRAVLNAELSAFQQISGLGAVCFTQLQAARELCRRSDFINLKKHRSFQNRQDIYTFFKRMLRDKKHETVAGLFLDNQHGMLAYEELFQGTINTANIHARPIVERMLRLNAAALILAHNHPSGLPEASRQDIEVTKRMQQALQLIDARLLDHLIIGDNTVFSIVSRMTLDCH